MKNRYRLVCYRKRGGAFYLHDKRTGHREPLDTTDRDEAVELLVSKNEAERNPALNRKKARIFLLASDPKAVTRTWTDALDAIIDSKPENSEVRHRWETFSKDEALEPILDVVLLETSAEQLLAVAKARTVSTNVFLRRLHNFCLGMNWLIEPVLPKALWPKIKFRKKRAIKREEHSKIIERERNPERKAFYELCWHLGGSQGDIANLDAEDVDWTDNTVCYDRKKLASLDETDVKPPLIKFGPQCAAVLRSLPQSGPLFPNLREVKAKDRANEFRQRCEGLEIEGVTLHSYRYAWAERARTAHYPRRQAEEALGHNCKAVHIAYARGAQVTIDSLEEYEAKAAQKLVPVNFTSPAAPEEARPSAQG